MENYIGLMRIRYTDDVDIRLDVEGTVPPEAKIPPLLLIVFVENAFKHGVSYNSPSYVHIAISCDGNTASCTVTNSRHDHTAAHDLQAMAAADTHAARAAAWGYIMYASVSTCCLAATTRSR